MTTITMTAAELAEYTNAVLNAGAELLAKQIKLSQLQFQSALLSMPFKQARNAKRAELVETKTKKKGKRNG